MTAHVIYSVLDRNNTATLSKNILHNLIREDFCFLGVLISDDISMKALSGGLGERARKAIEAGCDIALHCNGDMDEMREAAEQTNSITENTAVRIMRGEALRQKTEVRSLFNVEKTITYLKKLTGGRF